MKEKALKHLVDGKLIYDLPYERSARDFTRIPPGTSELHVPTDRADDAKDLYRAGDKLKSVQKLFFHFFPKVDDCTFLELFPNLRILIALYIMSAVDLS